MTVVVAIVEYSPALQGGGVIRDQRIYVWCSESPRNVGIVHFGLSRSLVVGTAPPTALRVAALEMKEGVKGKGNDKVEAKEKEKEVDRLEGPIDWRSSVGGRRGIKVGLDKLRHGPFYQAVLAYQTVREMEGSFRIAASLAETA